MDPLALLALARKYWKVAAGIALALALWWAWHQHDKRVFKAGEAATQTLWDADNLRRDKLATREIAKNEAKDAADAARNEVIEREHQDKLAAAERDRDRYAGLLHRARIAASGSAPAQGPDIAATPAAGQAGSPAPVGSDAGAALDAAIAAVMVEARQNADALDAVLQELKPQLWPR